MAAGAGGARVRRRTGSARPDFRTGRCALAVQFDKIASRCAGRVGECTGFGRIEDPRLCVIRALFPRIVSSNRRNGVSGRTETSGFRAAAPGASR